MLALGNFDGMHRGHLKIIERVRRGAEERGATAVAMTFDPHPSKIVRPDKAPPLLMTKPQKLEALAHAGMHGVAVVRFTAELAQWDPERFVRTVLVEWLHVAEVWVGANFLFGHDRAGNFTVLRSLGARYGFRAEKIDPVRYKDFVVSSTRIRRLVGESRVDEAGALLGHYYTIDGSVVHGQHRVGGRGVLGVVDHRLRQELADHAVHERDVLDVAHVRDDLAAAHLAPRVEAICQRQYLRQRVGRAFQMPAPAGEVVDDSDLVPMRRQSQGGGPAEVAVPAQDKDSHRAIL